jgi:hypothetical protein
MEPVLFFFIGSATKYRGWNSNSPRYASDFYLCANLSPKDFENFGPIVELELRKRGWTSDVESIQSYDP